MISLGNFKDKFIICFIIYNLFHNFCEICVTADTKIPSPGENVNSDSAVYVPLGSDVHDKFSWELMKDVFKQEKTNAVISPFSVKIILALLAEAACDNTQTYIELINALEATNSNENLSDYYKKILTSLRKESPHTTLNLETKMFTDAFIEPEQSYAETLANFYGTDIERLNFRNTKASANHINSWCKNVTNGKLKNLVTEDNIENSVIVLTNAIYFNGLWRYKFEKTDEGVFFTTPETKVPVSYMHLTGYFYYYDDSSMGAKILRLPYKGNNFSMFVLLPNKNDGLEDLIKVLENVRGMQFNMMETEVEITLPKFKFDFKKNLKDTLYNQGIHDIFTDFASLPGLDSSPGQLKVSNIFQKAGIEVNEKGTEADAATASDFGFKIASLPIEFTANHPFVFFIQEEATGSIIFAGKVVQP